MGMIFGQLGTKIFGGLSIALLLTVMGMGLALRVSHDKVDRLVKTNAALSVELEASLDREQQMVDDGKARAAAQANAVKAQAPKSAALQAQRTKIAAGKPTTGCASAPEVMNAEGL